MMNLFTINLNWLVFPVKNFDITCLAEKVDVNICSGTTIASGYRLGSNMVWADFYFCRSFKLWRKINAFGRFHRSPLKIPRRANILKHTNDTVGGQCGLKIRFLIKIGQNICKDLAWIFGRGSQPFL